MGNFYAKLAFQNVKRSRVVYLPYMIATAIISGVYFLILAMLGSDSISGVPSGDTARQMMMMGIVVFTLFAAGFMLYVNNFLVKRRKREFGLYAVLGMNKSQVSRILRIEGLIVIGGGVAVGMLIGSVFGRLLFMLLMNLIHAAPGSSFTLPLSAFLGTAALFAAVYVITAILNSITVARTGTSELLSSDRSGEKDPKFVKLSTTVGVILIIAAYGTAILTAIMQKGGTAFAIGLFFPAVTLVIIATFMLFKTGTIAVLRALRKNKKLYYKADNFIAISGMFHRMRQNARGLASICILFTMLLVTVAGTASLYIGQEEIIRIQNPMDVRVWLYKYKDTSQLVTITEPDGTVTTHGGGETVSLPEMDEATRREILEKLDAALGKTAGEYGLTLSVDKSKIATVEERPQFYEAAAANITVLPDEIVEEYDNFIEAGSELYFNIEGDEEKACLFSTDVLNKVITETLPDYVFYTNSIFVTRVNYYGVFGGLVFIGAFFAVLFLVGTVLIIYFKQVTEGYEDKERFAIMQKVGMDDAEVRRTIKKQIIWVFFLPLFGAILHIGFASGMIAQMLKAFQLYNTGLTFACVGVTSLAFGIVYLIVYLQTAKTYYKIVKR